MTHPERKLTHAAGVILAALLPAMMFSSPVAADTIFTLDGDEYAGELIEITPTEIVFKLKDTGEITRYPKSRIQRVELQKRRRFDDIESADAITDPVLKNAVAHPVDPARYPKSNIAVIMDIMDVTWTDDTHAVTIHRRVFQVLGKGGERYGNGSEYFWKDTEQLDIVYALTVTPDGKVVHLSDDALKSESLYNAVPRYDRKARWRYALKDVKPGAVVDIMTRKESTPDNPFLDAPGDPMEPPYILARFRGREPILNKVVTVRVPESQADKISWRLLRGDGVVSHRVDKAGNWVIHTWALLNPATPIDPEPAMPPDGDIAPRLVVAWASTWKKESADATELIRAIDTAPDSQHAVKTRAAAFLQNNAQPGTVMRAIYNFVARDISLVGPNAAAFRLTPNPAGVTLTKRSGNILDKCNLLYRLLNDAGIPARLMLARNGYASALVDGVPLISQYNRPVVEAWGANGAVYLYPSDYLRGFGEIPEWLQGADAIVIGDADGVHPGTSAENAAGQRVSIMAGIPADTLNAIAQSGVRITIPERPMRQEIDGRRIDMTVTVDSAVTVKETLSGSGENAIGFRKLGDLSKADLDTYFKRLAASRFNGATLAKYTMSDFKNTNAEEFISFTWQADGYCIRAGDKILSLKMPTIAFNTSAVGKPAGKRHWPLHFKTRAFERIELVIHVPAGYHVYYYPEPVQWEQDGMTFAVKASTGDNTLTIRIVRTRTAHDIPLKQYGACKRLIDDMAFWARKWIVLEKD